MPIMEFNGLRVIESVLLTEAGEPYQVRRSWRERLLPTALEPLGFIRCDMFESEHGLENQIHRQFLKLRHHGEWFRDDPELRAFIATTAQGWPA